jgi:plastocyanin
VTPSPRSGSSGVVVWLEPADGAATPPASAAGGTVPVAKILQKQRLFLPHVQAVQVGTAVDFPNLDPIFHNVFSNYDGQVFDLHLYAPQTSRRVVFRRPGIAYVFCNIHESMSAVVAVLPTSYFAVTGADGRFEIRAPAGVYRMQVWHERSLPEKLQELSRQVTLGEGAANAGEIRVSEEGYVARPHKNKYGQPYPPPPEEAFFYPGGRR